MNYFHDIYFTWKYVYIPFIKSGFRTRCWACDMDYLKKYKIGRFIQYGNTPIYVKHSIQTCPSCGADFINGIEVKRIDKQVMETLKGKK